MKSIVTFLLFLALSFPAIAQVSMPSTPQEQYVLGMRYYYVLSACKTGNGDINQGEGVFGQQHGFKKAVAQTKGWDTFYKPPLPLLWKRRGMKNSNLFGFSLALH